MLRATMSAWLRPLELLLPAQCGSLHSTAAAKVLLDLALGHPTFGFGLGDE